MIFFYSKLIMKIMKTGLKSKLRGKAVRLLDIYSLALAETSAWLKKTPPQMTTLTEYTKNLQKYLPKAEKILETQPLSGVHVENPFRAMQLYINTVETGVIHKLPIYARVLKKLNESVVSSDFSDSQKEKLLEIAADSYLAGWLAPITQFDLFSKKLDDLIMQTRCATREELMHELREKRSLDEILRKLDEKQKADIQSQKQKRPLTLAQKVSIINASFLHLSDLGLKHSFTGRTIQNWDNGKCPYEGYSALFNEIELISWANKIVGEIRGKQAVRNIISGLSEQEMSRRRKKR